MPKEFEVKTKMFKCEHCGSAFSSDCYFETCKICGQEVCGNCGENVELWNAEWNDWQDDVLVHKTCRRDHEMWSDTYIEAIKYLQNEFYKKIDELNKNYLSENDEYMYKWLDTLKTKSK